MARTLRERFGVAALAAALIVIPCVPAAAGDAMFLRLQTLYAYVEPSEFEIQFNRDGSSFTLACSKSIATRGVVVDAGRAAPVIKTNCEKEGRPRAGTVVWIHGGPFRPYSDELNGEKAALLSLGYDIVAPLYPGSADRELGTADYNGLLTFDDAIAEITATIRWAQKRDSRVILFGESFGGLLAGAAASTLRRSDRLILQNPLLLSPRDRRPPPNEPGEAPIATAMFGGEDIMEDLTTEQQHELTMKVYTTYMAGWIDRDLVSILREKPPRRMLVIYGDKDSRIGLDRMPGLLGVGGRRHPSLMLKDNDHESLATRTEMDAFIELLRK